MGKAGPARKPTALRLLEGARPGEVNQHEPIAPTLLPRCPDDEPAEVQEIFTDTVRWLDNMGIASAADTEQLVAYAWAVYNHRQASKVLARSPILVVGVTGTLVPNPAITVQRNAALLMRSFAQEFGLTPSARAGIEVKGAAGGDESNPFAGAGVG